MFSDINNLIHRGVPCKFLYTEALASLKTRVVTKWRALLFESAEQRAAVTQFVQYEKNDSTDPTAQSIAKQITFSSNLNAC